MKNNESTSSNKSGYLFLELNADSDKFSFDKSITDALSDGESELQEIEEQIKETLESIKKLTPDCDKLDYALAVSSGALCGIIDIFLVGKPKDSHLGKRTDKWFEDRTIDFAKHCGWDDNGEKSLSSAIKFLEKKFKIPYDLSFGDSARMVYDINPKNHHFKSLAHNPTLFGLFFSILD